MNNLTLTGVRGYIGTQYLNSIIKNNIYDNIFLILHNKRNDDKELLKLSNKIHLVYYDNTIDSIHKAITSSNTIIHFAALYKTTKDIETYNALIQSNITFFTHISMLAEENKNAKIIVPTTFSMLNLNGEYYPKTFYAATKAFNEIVASTFSNNYIFLRFPDTFGEHDNRKKILNIIANSIKNKKDIELKKDKYFKMNLINVKDIIAIINELIDKENNESINIYDLFYNENNIDFMSIVKLLHGDEYVHFSNIIHQQNIPIQKRYYNYKIKYPVRNTIIDVLK